MEILSSSVLYLVLVFSMTFDLSQNVGREDNDDIFDRLIVIKGKVIELNNTDLGETPANSNFVLIFQKDGCKTCLIATNPDLEGNYRIHVGKGKYRLIVKSPSPPMSNLLAPDQQNYIDARKPSSQVVEFDVKLKLPE